MAEKALAIGLYSYNKLAPDADGFNEFYDLTVSIFRRLGITPTYFAAEGACYKGSLAKFGGKTHAKALKSGFTDIYIMTVLANPEGSTEPAYDSYACASFSYIEATGETLFCLTVEERFLEFGEDRFKSILMSCISLRDWDFGYALSQAIEKKPEFHVLGLDDGKLTAEDRMRLNKWYSSLPEIRLKKIRDVYPVNVLNDKQLNEQISNSQTLGDVIRADSYSSLCRVEDSQLWLWEVQPGGLNDLRGKLANGGILIT